MDGHLKVLKELESSGHNPQAAPPDAEKLQDWKMNRWMDGNGWEEVKMLRSCEDGGGDQKQVVNGCLYIAK